MSKYKRILLKLSGESLQGKQGYGLDPEMLASYAQQIKTVADSGTQIGIVIGGGNIFRGMTGVGKGFDRVRGDQMGMLATVINSLALQSAIENAGGRACVLTSIPMGPVGAGIYSKFRALELMNAGYVVIIGGGTGNPFFTTDTASALRGVEIEADVLLKGTRVNGVYTADPEKDPTARKYDSITFSQVIEQRLKVMDLTAFTMCMENNLPIIVFDMDTPGNLAKVTTGEPETLSAVGTLVHN
ncbi:UMP kinase [Millionella massiliensis]|uniref:UMP kinase n=1 Tax=Millionella massiliensis TaxID=1871023 RepID=UPI0023A79C28|nr:UMP kinase [Millionella massiliensis]